MVKWKKLAIVAILFSAAMVMLAGFLWLRGGQFLDAKRSLAGAVIDSTWCRHFSEVNQKMVTVYTPLLKDDHVEVDGWSVLYRRLASSSPSHIEGLDSVIGYSHSFLEGFVCAEALQGNRALALAVIEHLEESGVTPLNAHVLASCKAYLSGDSGEEKVVQREAQRYERLRKYYGYPVKR